MNQRATLVIWMVIFPMILLSSLMLSWLLFEMSRLFSMI